MIDKLTQIWVKQLFLHKIARFFSFQSKMWVILTIFSIVFHVFFCKTLWAKKPSQKITGPGNLIVNIQLTNDKKKKLNSPVTVVFTTEDPILAYVRTVPLMRISRNAVFSSPKIHVRRVPSVFTLKFLSMREPIFVNNKICRFQF